MFLDESKVDEVALKMRRLLVKMEMHLHAQENLISLLKGNRRAGNLFGLVCGKTNELCAESAQLMEMQMEEWKNSGAYNDEI